MSWYRLSFILILGCITCSVGYTQSTRSNPLSIDGFSVWMTGRDSGTIQLIPGSGKNGLTMEDGRTVAHVRFKINSYGEISTPVSSASAPNAEPYPVNLSGSRFVKIKYKANQPVVLQLRQSGAHGGTHNHVVLAPSRKFKTTTIRFSSFKGGLDSLDLKNVAKFNFAFTANNSKDGYADLVIQSFVIDRYKP